MSLVDATLRHAVAADGHAADAAGRISRLLDAHLFSLIDSELRNTDGPLTRFDLDALLARIAQRAHDLRQRAQEIVRGLAEATASTSTAAFVSGLRREGVAITSDSRVAMGATAADWLASPDGLYAGSAWTTWADSLAGDAVAQTTRALSFAADSGQAPEDALAEISAVGRRAAQASDTLAATLATHVGNGVRRALADETPEIAGYLFVSVLDLRTSSMCRGLSGNVYRKGRGDVPRPPLHPNCRSQLVPLTADEYERLSGEQLRPPPPPTTDELNAAVDEGRAISSTGESRRTTDLLIQAGRGPDASIPNFKTSAYEQWLRTQSADDQRELLGRTRWEAWQSGVPISSLATSRRRLTLEQLRSLYPQDFAGTTP